MMGSKNIIVVSLSAALLLVALSPIFAQGKADQAKGQLKKEESQAVIGNVEKVTGNTLVLEDKKNKKMLELTIGADTKFLGVGNKPLKLGDIKPKDMVAILATESGTATEAGASKKALKVFVYEASPSSQGKRRAVHGIITGINEGVITLVHQIHQDRFYTLLTGSETKVKIKGVEGATVADLELGQRIAAVGVLQEDGTLLAKRVHVIPGKAKGVFRRIPTATPSATLTVTPTSTPSATPTATATPTLAP